MRFRAAAAVLLLVGLAACGALGPDDDGNSSQGCEVSRPAESRFLPFGRRAGGGDSLGSGRGGDLRDDVPEGWRC